MLEFFRRPEFWVLLGAIFASTVLGGYWWASGMGWRRAAAITMLVAALTLVASIGVKLGLVAAAVAAVTGVIVGAMGLEFGADRAPSHAVVLDSTMDASEIPDTRDLKRAS